MDLSLIITGILGIITLYLMHWLFTFNVNYWKKRGISSAISSPLAGIKEMLFSKKTIAESINDLYKKLDGKKFGGSFLFFTPVIMVRDPDLINHVLIKDFTHFEDRDSSENNNELFSFTLFRLTGDKWRNARHRLAPAFTSGKLKMMFYLIKQSSDELVCYLKERTGQDIEARELMNKFVYRVIGNIAFGIDVESLKGSKKADEFLKIASNFVKPSAMLLLKGLWNRLMPYSSLHFNIMESKADGLFRKMTHDLIEQRERSGEKRNDFLQIMLDEKKREQATLQNQSYSNQFSEPEDKELLDQLKNTQIQSDRSTSYETFTEEFMASQAFTFISGGGESTSTTLMFALYELAVNQDVQRKLYEEISRVLKSQEFSYEAVSKMNYLEQFINETLRLYPSFVVLNRKCIRDYQIPGTDFKVEKGTSIVIPVIGLHKDPQYFIEPEKFNPDRFGDMETVSKNVYLPFGGGPRFCIAMRLALLKMKIAVATLCLHYSVHLSEKTKIPLKIKKFAFGKVEGGMWLKFQNRQL